MEISKLDYGAWIFWEIRQIPDPKMKEEFIEKSVSAWSDAEHYMNTCGYEDVASYMKSSEHLQDVDKFCKMAFKYLKDEISNESCKYAINIALKLGIMSEAVKKIVEQEQNEFERTQSEEIGKLMRKGLEDGMRDGANMNMDTLLHNYAAWIFRTYITNTSKKMEEIDNAISAASSLESIMEYLKEAGLKNPIRYFQSSKFAKDLAWYDQRVMSGDRDACYINEHLVAKLNSLNETIQEEQSKSEQSPYEETCESIRSAIRSGFDRVTQEAYDSACDLFNIPLNAQKFGEEFRKLINDSGKRISYGEGLAMREPSEGKGRFDLVSPFALTRLAKWYELGAKKYDDRNWEKGGIPFSRYLDSTLRHLSKFQMGKNDEDHLAAAAWNIFCIMHFEELGDFRDDDLPKYEVMKDEEAESETEKD